MNMAFNITLPEGHEALIYLDSIIDQEYSDLLRKYANDLVSTLHTRFEDTEYQSIDEYFDAVMRHAKLIRGLQTSEANQAVRSFVWRVKDCSSRIEQWNESRISHLSNSLKQLVTTNEYEVYSLERRVRQGTEFNLIDLELSKRRIRVNVDGLHEATDKFVYDALQLSEIMQTFVSIAARFEEISNQTSTNKDEIDSLQKLYQQEHDRLTRILSRDRSDIENRASQLSRIYGDDILIKKGSLNEFKELCKEYLISNAASAKLTLNHNDIVKQIIEFSSDKLTITPENETILSELVSQFIDEYSNNPINVTQLQSNILRDKYTIESYRSKPLGNWYINLPGVIRNYLEVCAYCILMMSDNTLTFKYTVKALFDQFSYGFDFTYKGQTIEELDGFDEFYNEYKQTYPDTYDRVDAIRGFIKLHDLKYIIDIDEECFPDIEQVLEIKLS